MKFNIVTAIWSIALMLLTFQICLLWTDFEFTNTIAYNFGFFVSGFMIGLVIFDWSNR